MPGSTTNSHKPVSPSGLHTTHPARSEKSAVPNPSTPKKTTSSTTPGCPSIAFTGTTEPKRRIANGVLEKATRKDSQETQRKRDINLALPPHQSKAGDASESNLALGKTPETKEFNISAPSKGIHEFITPIDNLITKWADKHTPRNKEGEKTQDFDFSSVKTKNMFIKFSSQGDLKNWEARTNIGKSDFKSYFRSKQAREDERSNRYIPKDKTKLGEKLAKLDFKDRDINNLEILSREETEELEKRDKSLCIPLIRLFSEELSLDHRLMLEMPAADSDDSYGKARNDTFLENFFSGGPDTVSSSATLKGGLLNEFKEKNKSSDSILGKIGNILKSIFGCLIPYIPPIRFEETGPQMMGKRFKPKFNLKIFQETMRTLNLSRSPDSIELNAPMINERTRGMLEKLNSSKDSYGGSPRALLENHKKIQNHHDTRTASDRRELIKPQKPTLRPRVDTPLDPGTPSSSKGDRDDS